MYRRATNRVHSIVAATVAEIPNYLKPLIDYACLAMALALPMVVLGYFAASRGLFGPKRLRAAPWNGAHVMAAFFIYFALWIGFGSLFLLLFFGPETKSYTETAVTRCSLWASVAALPFQVILILVFLERAGSAQPYQIGLAFHRVFGNVVAGYLYWLFFMPGILLLNALLGVLYKRWFDFDSEPHIIQQLMTKGPTAADWLMAILSAVVAAPALEELLYRGVLQKWATCRFYRSDIVMLLSLAIALWSREKGLSKTFESHSWSMLTLELQPAAFVLAVAAFYAGLRLWCQSPVAPGIVACSLLFSILHATFWPSPIPLFPLAIVLGYLAYRTQSLVGPIVFHALFNGVAILGLLHHDAGSAEPAKGKPTTSAVSPVPSTWSFVPGESCPRRM
jgi:membrane protease YdiL (CAAX protease family)